MDAINAPFTRRSTREFTEQPIESEKLHQILDAAMKKTGYISMSGKYRNRSYQI